MQGRGAGRDGPGALPPRPLHDGGRPMRTGVRRSARRDWRPVSGSAHEDGGSALVLMGYPSFSTVSPRSRGLPFPRHGALLAGDGGPDAGIGMMTRRC